MRYAAVQGQGRKVGLVIQESFTKAGHDKNYRILQEANRLRKREMNLSDCSMVTKY